MGIKRVVWMITGISLLIMASVDSLLANDGSGADCGICHTIHEPAAVALPGTDGQADAAVTRMRVIKGSVMSGWCNHCHGLITQQAVGFDSHSAHLAAWSGGAWVLPQARTIPLRKEAVT